MPDRLKTLGALALLAVPLPANLALTATALVWTTLRRPARTAPAPSGRTVLLSGGKMTKALVLARAFHAAGHRVVLVESARYRLTGHRFSRAVDRFRVIPPAGDPGYAEALLRVVREERVDVYVPVCSPASSRDDAAAKALLSRHCDVLHVGQDQIDALDDKAEFARTAAALGLSVPETHRVSDPQEVLDLPALADAEAGSDRRHVLKSIAYDPVHRLDLTPLPRPTRAETEAFVRSKPITPDNPWILQELVVGTEFCTHGTVRDGELQVWVCCPSSASQLNYAMVDKPEIEAWVRRFVSASGLTGQASFDVIETVDGTPYAIECNPRTHSAITLLQDHPDLARAYLDGGVGTVAPAAGSRPTYWLYHELWRLVRHPGTARERLRVVREGRDAIFSWADPLPFLLVHHLQVPALLLRALALGRPWVKVDVNIGKLVEPAGD